MVKEKAGVTACDKTVLAALHAAGVRCRRLRERPVLTAQDMDERLSFAGKAERRTSESWVEPPHAVIDNKGFQL